MSPRTRAALVSVLTALALLPSLAVLDSRATAAGSATEVAAVAEHQVGAPPTGRMHWQPRPGQYPGTSTTKDLAIPFRCRTSRSSRR